MKNAGKLLVALVVFNAIALSLVAKNKAGPLYVQAGCYAELDYRCSYLGVMDVGIALYKSKRITLASEANIYKFWNDSYSSVGIGLRPAVKYYFLQRSKIVKLYAELRGGIIYMLPEYASTAVNFTLVAGPGADIFISRKTVLNIGSCYNHFSNGRYEGNIKNPTWDGVGGYIGISYRPGW